MSNDAYNTYSNRIAVPLTSVIKADPGDPYSVLINNEDIAEEHLASANG